MTTTMNTITTTDNEIREWLQGQIKGCLQTYGIQEPLYTVIHRALAEMEELEPLTDSDREPVREALELMRKTDWKLGQRQWGEARSYLTEAHNALRDAGVAVDSGVSWRRELYLEITELIESIEYAMIEPGSPRWNTWRGPEGCTILTLQPYYRDSDLQAVLDAWEDGTAIEIK